jgi:hypothetical protein
MAMRHSEETRRWQEAARSRIILLLNTCYAGRQRAMARAAGLPQSQISRIVNGQIAVSPRVLEAVAGLPGINPIWVREGVGEPLLPPTRGTLPIVTSVLPGWPERHVELLTGERHPVAEAFEQPSRYFLRLLFGSLLCEQASFALRPGDLLLLDANATLWGDNLSMYQGRLVGVKVRRGSACGYELGMLSRDGRWFVVDLFGEIAHFTDYHARVEFYKQFERPKRKVRPLTRPTTTADNPEATATQPPDEPSRTASSRSEPESGSTPQAPPTPIVEELVALHVYTVRPI